MAANWFERTYNFLANMGLVLRDDPPKVIDMTGRVWGDSADGLALSVREAPRDDEGRVSGISVVMRNTSSEARTVNGPLAAFYEVEGLTRSAYGRQLANSIADAKPAPVILRPGDAVETGLPIAITYDIRARGDHTLRVYCKLPDGGELRSNALTVRA